MDHYKAPEHLRRRILFSIEQERRRSWRGRLDAFSDYLRRNCVGLAAAAACGMASTLIGTQLLTTAAVDDGVMLQVASSHTRALVGNHLIDVPSSDRHTVKPWFAGKIDYSPRVRNFAADGFELAGGRVDYVNDRVVAALVYKRRLHVIDAYVWPTRKADSSVERRTHQGINAVEWIDDGMQYYLVSDVEFAELNELARLLRAHGD
jgi:anti-sigma factor RsiW